MVLNTAVRPGVVLLPRGGMVILEKQVPGFNNVPTVATDQMKFGLNVDDNKFKQPVTPPKGRTNRIYRIYINYNPVQK